MPLWDIEELLDLHKSEFAELAQVRVLELCKSWGPVPRSVLTVACGRGFQEEQEALITALPAQRFDEFIRGMANDTYPYGYVSGTVIHLHPDGAYRSAHPRFASEFIADKFIHHHGNQKFSEVIKFLKDTADDSAFAGSRGLIFEIYAHILSRRVASLE